MGLHDVLSFLCSPGVTTLHDYLEPVDLWRLSSTCHAIKKVVRDDGCGVYRDEDDWKEWMEKNYGAIKKKPTIWCTKIWTREMNGSMIRYAGYASYFIVLGRQFYVADVVLNKSGLTCPE